MRFPNLSLSWTIIMYAIELHPYYVLEGSPGARAGYVVVLKPHTVMVRYTTMFNKIAPMWQLPTILYLTLTTRALVLLSKIVFILSQISEIVTAISRINEPILGMFVLIWMYFSNWFQIKVFFSIPCWHFWQFLDVLYVSECICHGGFKYGHEIPQCWHFLQIWLQIVDFLKQIWIL